MLKFLNTNLVFGAGGGFLWKEVRNLLHTVTVGAHATSKRDAWQIMLQIFNIIILIFLCTSLIVLAVVTIPPTA